jgi:cholesterol transport system auxiliary component
MMTQPRRRIFTALISSGLMLGLSACITLLPEQKPAQLYRFVFNKDKVDQAWVAPTTNAAAPRPEKTFVYLADMDFPKAAAGDRILSTEGAEVAYIAQSRWAAPAQAMFRDAVSEGFDRFDGPIGLAASGRNASTLRLEVKVRRFEVSYRKKRPHVIVELDTALIRLADRKVLGTKFIRSDIDVKKSNMSDMVDGFETATSQVTAEVYNFTINAAASAPEIVLKP